MEKHAAYPFGKAEGTYSEAQMAPEPLSDDRKEVTGRKTVLRETASVHRRNVRRKRSGMWGKIHRLLTDRNAKQQKKETPGKPEWFRLVRGAVIAAIAIIVCVSPFAIVVQGASSTVVSASEKDALEASASTLLLSSEQSSVWTKLNVALSDLTQRETAAAPAVYYEEGMTDEEISLIQQRLMELGYMEEDEPTAVYGAVMTQSVRKFERKHNFEMDGILTQGEYDLLMSDQAQVFSVSIGAEGTDVEELQTRLLELGYLDNVTGEYGIYTEQAVKNFQDANGLSVDGKIGVVTRELLYSDDARANAASYGDEGEEIKTYQTCLAELGYYTGDADGYFGNDMVTAVKRFQDKNGLIADGAIGPVTAEMLFSDSAQPYAYTLGDSGEGVTEIQQRLVSLGYMSNATGYFGEHTETAVKRFQQQNGLSADGKVGAKTSSVLFSDSAKKYTAPTTSSSTGSGSTGGSSTGSGSTGGSSTGGSSTGGGDTSSAPSGTEATSGADSSKVEAFIAVAQSKLGCDYVLGAKGPDRFDCSGFVYWCLNQVGVNQSYMTSYGWKATTKYPIITSINELQRGDIICFEGHVGICLGNGQMIDASSTQDQIRITSLSGSYWQRNFIKGCRVF